MSQTRQGGRIVNIWAGGGMGDMTIMLFLYSVILPIVVNIS